MTETRKCRKCTETKLLTTDYFNQLSTGYWRGTCKVCMAENTRQHYIASPEKVKTRVKKYKDQIRLSGGEISELEKSVIRKKLGDKCYYCGNPLCGGGEWDHKQPVNKGGKSDKNNLILACRECNRDKHGKTAEEFIRWRRNLGRPVRADIWK
jgi:5-methylcytosine-specific restriction endonuclease McrA